MPTYTYTIATTGDAGSATGTVTTDALSGFVEAVQLDYNASAPATTDVTITEANGMTRAIVTNTDSATDAVIYPASKVTGSTDAYRRYALDYMRLTIAVADCDALSPAVTVRIQMSQR